MEDHEEKLEKPAKKSKPAEPIVLDMKKGNTSENEMAQFFLSKKSGLSDL